MKATYATVKSEAEYYKRKMDVQQAKKPPAPKRARAADENAKGRADALIEELLERNTQQLGACQPPSSQQQAAGPTDFSGLFPKAAAPPLAVPQPPPRQARTFAELAHTGRSLQPADSVLGFDFLHAPLGLPNREAANQASAAGAADRLQLEPAQSAPLDWSLKTTVRFCSPTPFSIADEAALLGGHAVLQAQRAAASGEGLHSLGMQQRYLAALHSWQFPADPGQPAAAGAARLRAPPPEVARRRADWQGAFASLYDALRCGACDAFYYVSPEGSKKPFAAFFGAAGVGGRPRLHALLTRSTSGLRALLAGGHALGFDSPLLPSEAERRALELDQAAVPMDGSQSLLVFEGALRVHGLFDFLLNESFRSHGDECDVPLLLAPAQFAHASLQAATPRALGPSDAGDPGRAQHRLELRGVALAPWVLDRLLGVLAVTQAGDFSLACDTHSLTLALNWRPASSACGPTAGAQAGGGGPARAPRRQVLGGLAGFGEPEPPLTEYEARQRGCWDADEAARWRAAVPGLACSVLRELRCEGGLYLGRLSAKSAERTVV